MKNEQLDQLDQLQGIANCEYNSLLSVSIALEQIEQIENELFIQYGEETIEDYSDVLSYFKG